jgi:hypothetical protein
VSGSLVDVKRVVRSANKRTGPQVQFSLLAPAHRFYPLCLGTELQAAANDKFVTIPKLMQKIGRQRADIMKVGSLASGAV